MPLRIVLDFDEEGMGAGAASGGWSEVAWLGTGTVDGYVQLQPNGIPVAGSQLDVLLQARLDLLSQVYRITHVRVTDTNPANGERSVDLPTSYGNGKYVRTVSIFGGVIGTPAPSAEAFAKLLLRMESGATRRRNWWLGGIPEEIVQAPQTYNPSPGWNGKLTAFSNIITLGGYGINGRPSKAAANQITSFGAFGSDGRSAQVVPVPTGAPLTGVRFYVILRGIKSPRGWNGVHLAYVDPSTTGFAYIGPTRKAMVTIPAFVPAPGQTVQLFAPVFANTDRVRPVRISRRKIGRPFGADRGRR